jgi:hypothetical protein
MRGVRARRGAIGMGALMAIGLTACGSNTTTVSTVSGTATISASGPSHNASVTIKTNKGTAQVDSGTMVPSNFPAAVPLPTFLTLSASLGASTQGKLGFDLIYDVAGNMTQAVDRYDQELRAAGFSSSETAIVNGVIEQVWKTSRWTVQVQGVPGGGAGQSASLDLVVVPSSAS